MHVLDLWMLCLPWIREVSELATHRERRCNTQVQGHCLHPHINLMQSAVPSTRLLPDGVLAVAAPQGRDQDKLLDALLDGGLDDVDGALQER